MLAPLHPAVTREYDRISSTYLQRASSARAIAGRVSIRDPFSLSRRITFIMVRRAVSGALFTAPADCSPYSGRGYRSASSVRPSAQKLLGRPQVVAVFEQVRGEAVPERVAAVVLRNPGQPNGPLHLLLHARCQPKRGGGALRRSEGQGRAWRRGRHTATPIPAPLPARMRRPNSIPTT